jgi:hypothetical protein
MGTIVSKEKKIKRLEMQIRKHKTNLKMVKNFENRIKTIKSQK